MVIQAQRAAVEAIHEDALPSLKQGKRLLENFYMERSRSRRELAQFFRSPRMRVVEREINVFMAETRVQHNYLKVRFEKKTSSFNSEKIISQLLRQMDGQTDGLSLEET